MHIKFGGVSASFCGYNEIISKRKSKNVKGCIIMDAHEEKIFSISVEWVQLESERLIKRRLTDGELYSVKKGIEWGLLTDIDTVFKAAIEEAVSQ